MFYQCKQPCMPPPIGVKGSTKCGDACGTPSQMKSANTCSPACSNACTGPSAANVCTASSCTTNGQTPCNPVCQCVPICFIPFYPSGAGPCTNICTGSGSPVCMANSQPPCTPTCPCGPISMTPCQAQNANPCANGCASPKQGQSSSICLGSGGSIYVKQQQSQCNSVGQYSRGPICVTSLQPQSCSCAARCPTRGGSICVGPVNTQCSASCATAGPSPGAPICGEAEKKPCATTCQDPCAAPCPPACAAPSSTKGNTVCTDSCGGETAVKSGDTKYSNPYASVGSGHVCGKTRPSISLNQCVLRKC